MGKDFIRVRNMEINAAKEITHQCDADALAIVLNDPDVMGNDVMGKLRIQKILTAWHEQAQEVYGVCSNGPERDYLITTLDRRMSYIFGDDLVPFAERYPQVVQPKPIGKRVRK